MIEIGNISSRLPKGRVYFPAQPQIEREPAGNTPTILREERRGVAVFVDIRTPISIRGLLRQSEQQVRKFIAGEGSTPRTGTWGIWREQYSNGRVQGEPQLLKEDVGRVLPVSVTRSGAVFLLQGVGIADVYTAELGSSCSAPPGSARIQSALTETHRTLRTDKA